MYRYWLNFLLIHLIFSTFCNAQGINMGSSFVNAYPKKAYKAGTQNWDIIRDKRGVVYFANNQGMLQFDGKKWNCYPLPNKTIIRSLALDKSGIIYAGGQNEFGYFAPNEQGDWTFHSLKHFIPKEYQNFADVWDVIVLADSIYFRTSKYLYCYFDEKIKVFHPTSGGAFSYLGLVGTQLVIQDMKQGLKYIQGDKLILIPGSKKFTHSPISGIHSVGENEWLISTLLSGFFKFDGSNFVRWQPNDNKFLVENKTYSSAVFKDGRIAFGTSLGGLLIVHPDGRTLQHLSKESGLLNNNILSMMPDNQNNLWLGMDDGINYALTGSPFTHFSPDGKAEGAGYSVIEHKNSFYFGTANGLFSVDTKNYYSPLDKVPFQKIKKTRGQVWGLNKIGNELILSHHGGGFKVENGEVQKITPDWGYWMFQEHDQKQLIAGTYTGIALFKQGSKKWNYQFHFTGLSESCRFFEQDNFQNIWMSHPYKGIYKLKIDAASNSLDVRKYGKGNGLPSDLLNHVFKINNEIIFCGETGVFNYNNTTDSFQPYSTFNEIFGANVGIKRLFESPDGDIWYVTDRDVGILKVQNKSVLKEIEKVSFPQLNDHLLKGFELIYPYDANNVFIGTEKGFIHYDPSIQLPTDSLFHVVLNEVSSTINGDSMLFKGIFHDNNLISQKQTKNKIPEFSPERNAFRFGYSATDFLNPEGLLFQIYLEGLEESGMEWTSKSEKEYTNLNAGQYTFHIKAKNQQGIESEILSYQFIILPHWYETTLAYFIYLLLFTGLIIGSLSFFNIKYSKQKEKVKLTEKEVNRLKNEKLEAEVAHKNRELASATFHLVHKNDILAQLKVSLKKIEKNMREKPVSKEFKQVIKMLEQEENSETGWEQFIAHFNKIHVGFFDKLNKEYPHLSSKDLKMCAYLRMNFSTKEIASLLNMTVRGVEGGRYRIRKKMGLDNKANLTDFILKY